MHVRKTPTHALRYSGIRLTEISKQPLFFYTVFLISVLILEKNEAFE